MCWVAEKCWYLDGSVQVGLLPAVVQQAGDGDAVRQVVDEGDVVDQVVSFSDAEDHDGGSALKHRSMLLKGHFTSFRLFTAQGRFISWKDSLLENMALGLT